MKKIGSLFLLLLTISGHAQFGGSSPLDDLDDDLSDTSDIFTDFSEDLEDSQVLEDERYYRHGRFFSFNIGVGLTTFSGNRGDAYKNEIPSFTMSVVYFMNFQTAIVLGLGFSQHSFFVDTAVNAYPDPSNLLGNVSVTMLRPFVGFRYYLDTENLGTALTFSNPYFIGRMEYWYQTNKFDDQQDILPPEKGGGLGLGLGIGLEFPIVIKKSYIGFEFLYHAVNYFDKDTQDYRQIPDDANSRYGFDDLNGGAWTTMLTYNFNW